MPYCHCYCSRPDLHPCQILYYCALQGNWCCGCKISSVRMINQRWELGRRSSESVHRELQECPLSYIVQAHHWDKKSRAESKCSWDVTQRQQNSYQVVHFEEELHMYDIFTTSLQAHHCHVWDAIHAQTTYTTGTLRARQLCASIGPEHAQQLIMPTQHTPETQAIGEYRNVRLTSPGRSEDPYWLKLSNIYVLRNRS